MANPSIFAAFERMWQHVLALASGKADTGHNHDDKYDVKGAADEAYTEALNTARAELAIKTANMATTQMVGTMVTNEVGSRVATHNNSTTAHSDIRNLITALSTKVNNFLDVDDTTADQLSEVLALIDSNKDTLASITSNKVNVSDIIDNLTTSDASKVLSAKQGVVLKELIDALQAEVDAQLSSVNAAIDNMANGTTPVQSATKATQDANGNVITDTYETKSDAQSKFDEVKEYTDEIVNALDEDYYTKTEIDAQVDEINTTLAQKAQVQIVTWEDDD